MIPEYFFFRKKVAADNGFNSQHIKRVNADLCRCNLFRVLCEWNVKSVVEAGGQAIESFVLSSVII